MANPYSICRYGRWITTHYCVYQGCDSDIEYINIDGLYQRHDNKILSYFDELDRIGNYKRKSDGKSLRSIPYAEMTDEENRLIKEIDNLWKKYI